MRSAVTETVLNSKYETDAQNMIEEYNKKLYTVDNKILFPQKNIEDIQELLNYITKKSDGLITFNIELCEEYLNTFKEDHKAQLQLKQSENADVLYKLSMNLACTVQYAEPLKPVDEKQAMGQIELYDNPNDKVWVSPNHAHKVHVFYNADKQEFACCIISDDNNENNPSLFHASENFTVNMMQERDKWRKINKAETTILINDDQNKVPLPQWLKDEEDNKDACFQVPCLAISKKWDQAVTEYIPSFDPKNPNGRVQWNARLNINTDLNGAKIQVSFDEIIDECAVMKTYKIPLISFEHVPFQIGACKYTDNNMIIFFNHKIDKIVYNQEQNKYINVDQK
jgi:hypothetical protein